MPGDLQITALDLFSGPGGLTLGMKAAGIVPAAGVELNRDAAATYRRHSPEVDHFCADIRDIDLVRYRGAVDVVFGGPPCQPFSLGGRRRGSTDSRDMVPEFIRAVRETRPRAVVMENVPGLLTKRHRAYFEAALAAIEELGFFVSWRVLSADDYGVPQRRQRVFVVGMREQTFRFPRPTHGPDGSRPYVAAGTILSGVPIGEPAKSPVYYAPVVDLRPSPYAGHVYKGGGRPINLERPSPTVYASAGGNKTHWVDTAHVAPEYHAHLMAGGAPREGIVPGARRLSVEETALLQTFPSDFVFEGSKSSRYTQAGDAVPPRLAQVLGGELAGQLREDGVSDLTHYPAAARQEALL